MAQRLIRKLCPHCKKQVTVESLAPVMRDQVVKTIKKINKDELTSRVNEDILKNPVFYEPV